MKIMGCRLKAMIVDIDPPPKKPTTRYHSARNILALEVYCPSRHQNRASRYCEAPSFALNAVTFWGLQAPPKRPKNSLRKWWKMGIQHQEQHRHHHHHHHPRCNHYHQQCSVLKSMQHLVLLLSVTITTLTAKPSAAQKQQRHPATTPELLLGDPTHKKLHHSCACENHLFQSSPKSDKLRSLGTEVCLENCWWPWDVASW